MSKQETEAGSKPTEQFGWKKKNRWFPPLAVAASLLVAVQIGMFYQQTRDNRPIEPLSEHLRPAHNHWLVQVDFDPRTDWQTIVATIDELGATIVAGPSPTGLVLLGVNKGMGTTPTEGNVFTTEEALLTWLSQRPGVVHAAIESRE